MPRLERRPRQLLATSGSSSISEPMTPEMIAKAGFPHISRQVPENTCVMGLSRRVDPPERFLACLPVTPNCSPSPFSRAFPRNQPLKCSRTFVFRAFSPPNPQKMSVFHRKAHRQERSNSPRNACPSRSPEHFRAMDAGNDRGPGDSRSFPAESAQLLA